MEFKIKNKRYCCDVDECDNYAYAEMYRVGGKDACWMYVCKKHYQLKLGRSGKPKEKDIGFYILKAKDRNI